MKTRFALTLVCAALAACGGGGGDAPAAETAVFNIANIERPVGTFTLNGTHDGHALQMVIDFTAVTPQHTSISTMILRVDGIVAWQDIVYQQVLGGVTVNSLSYTTGEYTEIFPIRPSPARVGEAGALGTFVTYSNTLRTTALTNGSVTWTLEDAAGLNTALYCTNNVGGSICFIINPTGHMLGTPVMKLLIGEEILVLQ